jgi:hypothetical protein
MMIEMSEETQRWWSELPERLAQLGFVDEDADVFGYHLNLAAENPFEFSGKFEPALTGFVLEDEQVVIGLPPRGILLKHLRLYRAPSGELLTVEYMLTPVMGDELAFRLFPRTALASDAVLAWHDEWSYQPEMWLGHRVETDPD